ncbi:hypothetical protein FHG87_022039 [Trinorchestia longiramus]|nr:hypothetical protein FHG87_022039 [Trinorchestia longiramus]
MKVHIHDGQNLIFSKCVYGDQPAVIAFYTANILECSKYDHERESFMDVVYEQYGENQWNARCVEQDSGVRYLVPE